MIAPQSLPGGWYDIGAEENAALCRVLGDEPDAYGLAHPLYSYIATQAAMGVTVAELCALCAFDVAAGPMIVGNDIIFERSLMVGQRYQVSGEIVSLTRKPSRTFGAVDLLDYRLVMTDAAGRRIAICSNGWVLPRRTGADA